MPKSKVVRSWWKPVAAFTTLTTLLFSTSSAQGASDLDLSGKISNYLAQQPGGYSVTAMELGADNREVHLGDSTQVDPASIFKLYYAWLALEKIQDGKWQLSTKLKSNYSVQTCLKLMISYSDNECASDIRLKLGIAHINSKLASLGLNNSHVVSSGSGSYLTKHTTTADVATLLSKLHQGRLLDAARTKTFIALLKGQIWRSRISSALQTGTVVASKSGQLQTTTGMIEADSAIIFGPRSTYVLVVIGRSGASGAAVRGVSNLVYRQWQGEIISQARYPSSQLVTNAATYLRSKPGGSAIKRIAAGVAVTLAWSERGWLFVKVGGQRGYVYQSSVRLSNRYLHWGSP